MKGEAAEVSPEAFIPKLAEVKPPGLMVCPDLNVSGRRGWKCRRGIHREETCECVQAI